MERIFVSGIGTGVGKTLVSAILTEMWTADYWKPVQTGYPADSDSDTVRKLISNSISKVHPESYVFGEPMSPHIAAEREGKEIVLNEIVIPYHERKLIIEGAGGLMVPLNRKGQTMIDLIRYCNAQVVLVSRDYLGSINHTLLSIEILKQKEIPIKGIVFCGHEMHGTRSIIKQIGNVSVLGSIPEMKEIDRATIKQLASKWQTEI